MPQAEVIQTARQGVCGLLEPDVMGVQFIRGMVLRDEATEPREKNRGQVGVTE